ncbi:MAG: C40 family peptidase [Sphingomonadales bacterium]|nr:C40 family peptidase [Sphingomonadales bacterium]
MQNDVVARARALLNIRFRLHGRTPELGLDCVGLIAFAYRLDDRVPNGYSLRSRDLAHWERVIRAHGFVRRRVDWRRGDLLVVCPGPAQIHLGLWTGDSLIHADAGLGRIVETPGTPRWPVLSAWLRRKGNR